MRRVLLVAHALPSEERSGTPFTTLGYAHALAARGHEVTVLHAAPDQRDWRLRPVRRDGEPFARVAVPRVAGATVSVDWSVTAASRPLPDEAAAGFGELLDALDPDVVHVMNLVWLPLEIPELAKARGLPVVRSVTGTEDLCGMVIPVSAVSHARGVCEPPLSPAHCARCVRASWPALAASYAREGADDDVMQRMLERKRARAVHQYREVFDRIVFPSAAFRTAFERSLPLDDAKVHEIAMGMDLAPWGGDAVASARPYRARDPATAVTFVVASTKEVQKGIGDVVDAFTSPPLATRDDWRLRFLGGGDPALVARLADDPRVEVAGTYDVEDLPRLLEGADVGLSVSRAETFHRTTREYLLAGLPVVGTAVGGIPEVVVDGHNGRIVDRARPEHLAETMTALLDRPEHLESLRAGACATFVRPLADEVTDLLGVYDEVAAATVRP